ncbi:phage tail tube protein [Rubinisphaera brasiliensis]|uniref:Uncharacterized protein n=1 Tax=Rubinisphaera brasiliensis (strain ATCC 49424 / DSM 5305 / JCM 21570 / IAM 15109 / NBRC 103401 / IFAM 1448) TaxID=756272 RepID=F0SPF5_RUBBR|nr:phage tail tube protein [Rubinisphaera brasiliensis]ADY57859.1 hypothetical protein Plabr_0230 [Rubinisphaera brasiliensis DSM 5305]
MSQGSQAKLLMDSVAPIDTNSESYAFISENLKQTVELDIDNSIRGTRSKAVERSGVSLKRVGGNIRMRPSPTELDNLLPRILGATEDSDSFALAETVPEFIVAINKVGSQYTYSGCKVGVATFTGSEGQAVELSLDVVGKTRAKSAAGSFPSVAIDTDTYYTFWQGVLTLDSTEYNFRTFEVKIDNMAEVLFENSVTATTVEAADRMVTLTVDLPYDSDANSFQDDIDNAENISGSLVFTNGNQSLTFTFGALMAADEDPEVSGKSKIRYPISFTALTTGTTKELVVTHDSSA